ncbi:MAG: type 1 glutamine amidotransferase [Candidatus Bipolaricaulia bacterium]
MYTQDTADTLTSQYAVGRYTSAMPPRVLIVDNAVHRFLFKPCWHWKAHLKGIDTRIVNVPSGAAIPPLDAFTHIILTGSEASIIEPKPWFEVEAMLIREAVDRGIPILGSCFGHQMLVYALSGPDYLQRSDPPEVGWAKIEMAESDPLFDGLPNPWNSFVYHFDEVVDPPEPWRKLGRTRLCDTHVLRYGDRRVWGIQAHPEMSSWKARIFLRFTLLLGRKPVRHIFHALRNAPPRNDVADTVLQRFLALDT